MPKSSVKVEKFEKIPFQMHPRVFAALGADLVTSDVVAVIELVKNSYDAFASTVTIRFGDDYLEIEDDGLGMTRDVIEQAWCMVATPYKDKHPTAKRGRKRRRVVGEKGLGRLSAARLGERLHMLTKADGSPCWEVEVDWSKMKDGMDLSGCYANCREYQGESPFKRSGTRIRVHGLRVSWSDEIIGDLSESLGRLISPFERGGEFHILIDLPGRIFQDVLEVRPPDFLSNPKYSISGKVNSKGRIEATYKYAPILHGEGRIRKIAQTWEQIYDTLKDHPLHTIFSSNKIQCGPFTFEIRAWDIAGEDTLEIEQRFNVKKSKVREAIRARKGISLYRDGILILPKTESNRDWLGLDLRRISRVGTRLSTSQIVGYVALSAAKNPEIKDTSDRERLASSRAVAEFEEILKALVAILENQRDSDRPKRGRETTLKDLFGQLSAEDLVSEVADLAEKGKKASDASLAVQKYSEKLEAAKESIQERFVYYSRLATVGTIAQMLVHEIRNRTTALGRFLRIVKSLTDENANKDLRDDFRNADESVDCLERLADTFAPLASRSFRRRSRHSVIEERIQACVDLQRGEIERKGIKYSIPESHTLVAVDPGELDTILLNLITNAVYWLGQIDGRARQIEFGLSQLQDQPRIQVWVHDNGPGVSEEDRAKILWPGFTRKPGGIGMGLTVASELVEAYDGRMGIAPEGALGGATFVFDIPLKE